MFRSTGAGLLNIFNYYGHAKIYPICKNQRIMSPNSTIAFVKLQDRLATDP